MTVCYWLALQVITYSQFFSVQIYQSIYLYNIFVLNFRLFGLEDKRLGRLW